MDLSALILLSQEQALRRRLDVVANNMANATTTGFKREQPLFQQHVDRNAGAPDGALRGASFVLDYGTVHDTSQGVFQTTGNPLDLMIEGPGYFAVDDGRGGTAYSRAGHLQILESGELGTATGHRVLDDQGRAITVPATGTAGLTVRADGTLEGRDGPLGRIAVTVFDNEATVDPQGDGLFSGLGGRVLDAADTRIAAGGVEGSNVQPIAETTAMIDILRSYQSSVKLADAINDMRKRAIERLGRAS